MEANYILASSGHSPPPPKSAGSGLGTRLANYFIAIGAMAGIHESASVLVSPAGSGDLDSGSRSITISPWTPASKTVAL